MFSFVDTSDKIHGNTFAQEALDYLQTLPCESFANRNTPFQLDNRAILLLFQVTNLQKLSRRK